MFAIVGAVKGGVLMALDECMGGMRMASKWRCKGGVLSDQLVLWLQWCRQPIAASLRHRLAPEGSKCHLVSLMF